MICVYFIGGSHFTRNIQPSPKWVTQFKNRGYIIKCARVADLDMILNHTVRIDRGGSNNIENLVALCRECHGKKTAFEKF